MSELACVAGSFNTLFSGFDVHPVLSCDRDNGVNLYENEAMRRLVVLATLAAATGLAAEAHADPSPDADFLAALDKGSISYHSGPEAIAAAKQVCDWINQGQRRSDVIEAVSAGNPGFAMSGAAEFTTLAERAYCPQHPDEPAAQQPQPMPPSWYQIQFPLPTPGAG
jgi:Protein of unknown function (DUF732)